MARLHLIGGEKGGVGKSFTSRLLAQYYIDNKQAFTGFDTDQSHPTFSRFYKGYARPVNINKFSSLDAIIEEAEAEPEQDIIVDLAAQTWNPLWKWIEESDLVELMAEMGFTVYFWQVMDDSADCAYLLQKQLDRIHRHKIQLMVVLNEGRSDNFGPLKSSPVYAQAESCGASFFELSALNSEVAQKIDFSNSSFWAAINNRDSLKNVERIRARVWVFKQYEKLKTLLEPTVDEMLDELESNIVSGKFQTMPQN